MPAGQDLGHGTLIPAVLAVTVTRTCHVPHATARQLPAFSLLRSLILLEQVSLPSSLLSSAGRSRVLATVSLSFPPRTPSRELLHVGGPEE